MGTVDKVSLLLVLLTVLHINPVLSSYSCPDSSVIIPDSQVCDFTWDCTLGEDESTCPDHCSFDSTVTPDPYCKWTQDVSDDFDWSWYSADTASGDFLGPGFDHSTGTSQGHYVYVDGSSSDMDHYARLISPWFKKSARSCKFTMWYYMFGVEYGDLEVRLRTQGGVYYRLTKVNDDLLDYNKWILSESQIPTCTTDFQIVIETEDKQPIPQESGFAVDDVSFANCAYPRPVAVCAINEAQCNAGECYPAKQQCDFVADCCDLSDENSATCTQLGYDKCDFEVDFCSWTQLTIDEFDWTRNRGDTPTEDTGPGHDHTTGSGWYIYTEASDPRLPGDRARLSSVTMQGVTGVDSCTMRFYYHMFGIGIGTLSIYTRTQVNGLLTQEWTMTSYHPDEWYFVSLDLRSLVDFQIIIEGTIGIAKEGDIALDDISLTPECTPSGSTLPTISTQAPSQIICTGGQLPCNMGCIDPIKYCDFRHDCLPGEEDEMDCPVYCGFDEDDQLCLWTQDRSDDGDWQYYDKNEDPGYKGPLEDHTTGAQTGHYIYVDGSISQEDDYIRLISPMYKLSARTCTFSLWYFLFGIEYGDLEIRLIDQQGLNTKLSKAGDDAGDYYKWMQYITDIPTCSRNFQIVVETEDRQVIPSEGGIAVDDLLFSDCEYPLPPDSGECPTGQVPCGSGECYQATRMCDLTKDCCDNSDEDKQNCINLGYSVCDFEGGMCDWEQLASDEFDWTRRKGSTSSSGTGPTSDHTLGTADGYYLYTEASDPRRNGERAKLASFPIESTVSGLCALRLFYHMDGIGIGSFNIYIRTATNGPLTLLWSWDRAIGGNWVYLNIPLRSNDDFQVVLEGVIGYTTDGDIGLDDVTLPSECVRIVSLPDSSTQPWTFPTPARTISPCPEGKFFCLQGRKCIEPGLVCDGNWDCNDGTDEFGCPCPGGQLSCSWGCIAESKYCDFNHDCMPHDDDELQCPASCDFEKDFCFWTQDKTDNRDWLMYDIENVDETFKGPNTDHTTGSLLGHYVYVNGKVFVDGQHAKLISPTYKNAPRGCTFSVWYFMFGLEFGDLFFRLQTDGGVDRQLTQLKDDAPDYNKWQQTIVDVPPCTTNFRVVIDAKYELPFPLNCGFAVDDTLFDGCENPMPVTPGTCGGGFMQCTSGECYVADNYCDFGKDCCDGSDEQKQTCIGQGYSMCDFEQGMCDWQQLTTDNFDWTRQSGSTGSHGTGPDSDHTFGTLAGYYVYTDASNPKQNGDKARLASFPIAATTSGNCLMKFFYHMEGFGIGSLIIYTRTVVNGPLTLVWTKDTAVGDHWVFDSVTLQSSVAFEIVIEGVIGVSTEGDIALDDISLTPACVRTATIPGMTTPQNTEPTRPTRVITLPNCFGGQYYCVADQSCISGDLVCDDNEDCSDGADEDNCEPEEDNTALIIGLSVTFGLIFLVACGAGAFYCIRSRDSKSADTSGMMGASFTPGTYEQDNPIPVKMDSGGEVAFTNA